MRSSLNDSKRCRPFLLPAFSHIQWTWWIFFFLSPAPLAFHGYCPHNVHISFPEPWRTRASLGSGIFPLSHTKTPQSAPSVHIKTCMANMVVNESGIWCNGYMVGTQVRCPSFRLLGEGGDERISDWATATLRINWDIRGTNRHKLEPTTAASPTTDTLIAIPLRCKQGFHHFWIISDSTHCHNNP